jgi:hypothetical protein
MMNLGAVHPEGGREQGEAGEMDGFRGGLMEAASTASSDCNLALLKVAAVRLGVSVRTLYRVIGEGDLALVRIRGCSCVEEGELQN